MIDERIVESVLNGRSEIIQIFPVKRQRRDNLIIEQFVHEAAYVVVVHTVADNVEACEIRTQHEARMRSVEYADFALLVGRNVRDNVNWCSGFLERKTGLQLCRTLDDPHSEHFADIY